MVKKTVGQKQRMSRTFLKETVMTQFFVLAFVAFLIVTIITLPKFPDIYSKHSLPPLSNQLPWGIFNPQSLENQGGFGVGGVQTLYYSPNNHQGVTSLVDSLVEEFPLIKAIGVADPDALVSAYQSNLFSTWAALEFNLSAAQIESGMLVTSQDTMSVVDYTILINPSVQELPSTDSDYVFNQVNCAADKWWSSGYMTLQNFIPTYLAKQYDFVSPNFKVETFIQRYPSSPDYPNNYNVSYQAVRWIILRWMFGPIFSVLIFYPMLGILTDIVKERQMRMKDLLEISGLMSSSYWASYVLIIILITQITIWVCLGLMLGFNLIDQNRVLPYSALLTCYAMSMAAFGMAFGFVVPRAEYYGLPIFLLNTALAVAGDFVGWAYHMNTDLKLFISFLSPSIALTEGVFVIETYLYHFPNSPMDYTHYDAVKHYPSLQAINGMMGFTMIVYFCIAWGMPFDWLFKSMRDSTNMQDAIADEFEFPCDLEEVEGVEGPGGDGAVLLEAAALSHVYPDGTHAVKNISFKVKEGEVLSFLGANGAGKSTCMGMLCGTLDATVGDALVNGHSISNNRTIARRNLGICFQQDIIWNDISVEDHLYLFGRLRGLHGSQLRSEVDVMLDSLGFPEKRKSLAGQLSGGQKRRLCVGLSMVGGNAVVYLDEPTAGLDPVSRRQLWELVERNRKGRAILLTTHFMDEADVLGDRIAVVKEGRLRALGTSRFLKDQFGLGYLLRMSLAEGADADTIQSLVTAHVAEASVASRAGTELSLRLPKEAVGKFPELFEDLEARGQSVGVLSFGIETTTLEEVFMRIVNEDTEMLVKNHTEANRLVGASPEERDEVAKKITERDNLRNPLSEDQMQCVLYKGAGGMFVLQVLAMIHKRFFQFVRSRGQWTMGFIVPILVSLAVGAVINGMPSAILAGSLGIIDMYFGSSFSTPVAAASPAVADQYVDLAFGNTMDVNYVGQTYTAANNYVSMIASEGYGPSSASAVVFDSINNFTVMYNASYPITFANTVQGLLESAISNATKNLLVIRQSAEQLPAQVLNDQENDAVLVALLMSLFAGSIGAGMSIVVGAERLSLVKHQQMASGASTLAYWVANFIFDMTILMTHICTFAGILSGFDKSTYGGEAYGIIVGTGVLFAVTALMRFYFLSFFVADVKMAQTVYFYGSILSMFVIWTIFMMVTWNGNNGNASTAFNSDLSIFLTIADPIFSWFVVIIFQHNLFGVLTQYPSQNVLGTNVAGSAILFLIIALLVYTFALVGMEGGLSCCFYLCRAGKETLRTNPALDDATYRQEDVVISTDVALSSDQKRVAPVRIRGLLDPDVVAERAKVGTVVANGINTSQNAIFIHGLKKVYVGQGSVPTKIAVKNVSVSIPHGEIFGLLGANGAGKTTLLKMVSGQEKPTEGRAWINGFDVVQQTTLAQRSMGLCPQFDTLIERLSVRENLLFFGKLKGLQGARLTAATEAFMGAMSIKRYENKLIQQLSGGNRRKVSLAVALLGAPPTVYLDEPSTGLDPVASRLMWRLLSRIATLRTTAIVLTTHNMLECEAVCTRICIMKNGEMVCLGDSQHLRSTHGTGFLLEMTLTDPSFVNRAKEFVQVTFPNTSVIDEHSTMINFEIPRESITRLSQAFRCLETQRRELGIIDYALSQSTLEQVFLKQIRPNDGDAIAAEDAASQIRVPFIADYFWGYLFWLIAMIIPGLHHFWLGNPWRGLLYLCTLNEFIAGWFLDLFEMHVLIQKSVQQHGHASIFCCCWCCANCCWSLCSGCCWCCLNYCCCCFKGLCPTQNNPPSERIGSLARQERVSLGDEEENVRVVVVAPNPQF